MVGARLRINAKQLIDLCHNVRGHPVLGIQLNGIEELASRMSPIWSSR
jgi:hypothetical protein